MTTNQLKLTEILETKRHNQEMEKLGGQELAEAHRHNVVYEGETNRHNLEQERLSHEQNVFNYTVGMSQAAASHRMAGAAERQALIASKRAITDRLVSFFNMRNERYKAQTQAKIGFGQLEAQKVRNMNDFILGMANVGVAREKNDISWAQLDLRSQEVEANIAKSHAETARAWSGALDNITDSFSDILSGAGSIISAIIK